jgi:hypothetical protein
MKARNLTAGLAVSLAAAASFAVPSIASAHGTSAGAAHYNVSETNDGCGSSPTASCYPGGNVNIFPSGADDAVTQVGLPFPVYVYGKKYTTVWVSSNGDLQFGVTAGQAQDTYFNEPLPSSDLSLKAGVAPFWDDLIFNPNANPIQGVFYRTTTFRGESAFIISWRGTEYDSGNPVRVEAIFYQNSKTITFQYVQTGDGGGDSATIGIQKSPSGPTTEFSYDDSGAAFTNMELDYNWT